MRLPYTPQEHRAQRSSDRRISSRVEELTRELNQDGTWQNWVATHLPQPMDFVGAYGTPYNLGSFVRRATGWPQLKYDAGLAGRLGNGAQPRTPAIQDYLSGIEEVD